MEKTNLLHKNQHVKSVFKNGETDTNTHDVTVIWAKLIEKLEQSKRNLSSEVFEI